MTARLAAGFLCILAAGCAGELPCYPPSWFAPPAGAPYEAEEVRIATAAGHVLAGTLTLPTPGEPPFPAVVLVTGSHAQDRDHMQSNREPVRRYRPFRQIADALSRGIDGVILIGCKHGDDYQCHYVRGSELANTRLTNLQETLTRLALEPERVKVVELAHDESDRIPRLLDEFADELEELGASPLKGF